MVWVKSLAGGGTVLMTIGIYLASTALPQSAIPEPLGVLREFSVAIACLAVLLAWELRKWLRTHAAGVLVANLALLVVLILVHLQFVKPVHYRTLENGVLVDTEQVWYITGWAVPDSSLQDLTSDELIRRAGGGWDELRAVWGRSFDVMAFTYSGLFLLAIGGLVLSTAAGASANDGRASPTGSAADRKPPHAAARGGKAARHP